MKHLKTFESYSNIDENKFTDIIGTSDKSRGLLWLKNTRNNQALFDKMKPESQEVYSSAMSLYKKWYEKGVEKPIDKSQKAEKEADIEEIIKLITPLRNEYEKNIGYQKGY